MITKKDIPLDLLRIIEPIAQSNLDLIQFKREENTYYLFVEVDSNSNNFFKIFIDGSKCISNYDWSKYAFQCKPANNSVTKHIVSQTTLEDIGERFKKWIQLIRDIHETPSVHDDNFIKQYTEFYYKEFQIVDADADISPFDPRQQDLVEHFLLTLANAIKKSKTELDETLRAEFISDIHVIQGSLSTTTKNQVIKAISKVFGKLYKSSRGFAKEMVTEMRKNLIKKLIELGIEYGPKLLEMLSKQ